MIPYRAFGWGRSVSGEERLPQSRRKAAVVNVLGLGRIAALLTLAALVGLRIWDPPLLESLRGEIFDTYQRVQPRVVTDYPVTIVDIDERSLKEIGQWPWSRATLAALVDRLAARGAVAIGFDVLFAEPDRLSPPRFAETVGDTALKMRLEALPDNDARFAEAIARTRVVLGQGGASRYRAAPARHPDLPVTSVATIGDDLHQQLLRVPGLVQNLPALERAAAGRGLFTVEPDADGVIRRIPTLLYAEGRVVPSLSIELLRVATGATSILAKSDEAGVRSVVVAGVEIETERDGQLWLHFTPHDLRRYVSAADVLAGRAPEDRINGKLILVGTSAAGLFDLRSTPLERAMPGVEIHAQAVESILDGALLLRPNYALGLEICLAIAIGVGIVVIVPMLGALPTLLLGVITAALLAALSGYLFVSQGILLDVVYPLVSSTVVFLLLASINYVREEQRRAGIRSAFSQYLAPELVEQLTREPDRLKLGGETRTMSVLFSDVRGFTSIAESFKDNPSGLTELMNSLLTPLSRAVIERRGTIDKYIGDAIMAFWNAPLDDSDHARHACEAGLAISDRLDELNAALAHKYQRGGENLPPMEIGIGISTGVCMVGNMGSDIRFDYSVLGDSVNLASRLQGLASSYGLRILVCPETAARCRGELATIDIDDVRVRGRLDAVTVHSVFGGSDLLRDARFRAFRTAFVDMRAHYGRGEWDRALAALEVSQKHSNDPRLDRLLDLYARRITTLVSRSPLKGWNGVFSDALQPAAGFPAAAEDWDGRHSWVEGSWTEPKLKVQ